VPGTVRHALVHQGSLVIGGDFPSLDLPSAGSVLRLTDGGWEPVGGGMEGGVTTLGAYGRLLVAAGDFEAVDGTPARGIAAFRP
jgi:hypothetical protein